jgi:uncharacterized protein (TIGR02118 family)
MVKLIVLFRPVEIPAPGYDQQYNDFLIMVDRLPGMLRKAVSNVYAGPGGFVPYRAVVEAYFESPAALQAALTSPPGVEAGNALIAFAGADAFTLFAEVLEENYPQS